METASFVIYNPPYESVGFGGYNSFDPSESYQLFSVDYTDYSSLRNYTTGLVSAFEDLGDGTAYNDGYEFTTASNNAETTMVLNASFISDVQSMLGGEIAFGGKITSLDFGDADGEMIFLGSHDLPLAASRLIVTTTAVPEPGQISMITSFLIFFFVFSRNRRPQK